MICVNNEILTNFCNKEVDYIIFTVKFFFL